MSEAFVGVEEIEAARATIAGRIEETPFRPSPTLTALCGVPVTLKLEQRQRTGSFKLRGASNAVARLTAEEKARGVVGVSTGNHGRGLAHGARAAGVRCVICMSRLAPQVKIDGIAAEGAEIRIVGRSQDEAQEEVDRLVARQGMTMIPPFDHRAVIAGQGTLGLEVVEAVPDVETVLVPVSGGGLVSGVAAAVKARCPDARVVGVSMERGAAMHASLAAGRPVLVEELPTLADALGGGIGLANRHTFAMTRALVDDLVLVNEREIAAAIRHAFHAEGEVVEGSGAVGIAALQAGKVRPRGPAVVLVTGANIDAAQHRRIAAGEDVDVTGEAA